MIATMTSMEGWSRYFEDISHFLEGAERQYGIANESFTEYVLEQLELCIRTCTTLTEHLDSEAVPNLDEGEVAIIEDYLSTLLGLLHCLRSLRQKWVEYKGIIEATSHDFSYQAGIMERRGRGRSRFNIGQEQLEYLASLSFSWSEIASLFGVSRMTIYRYASGDWSISNAR